MRQVKLQGCPPQEWLDLAADISSRIRDADGRSYVEESYRLELIENLSTKSSMTSAGNSLVVIGKFSGILLIRVFCAAGSVVAEVEQAKREPPHSPFIELHALLNSNWDVSKMKPFEKREIRRISNMILRKAMIKEIIDANEGMWRDARVRDWLKNSFNSKCWYSEAQDSVSAIHVDHYRPKGQISDDLSGATSDGYWWLGFDWTNYRICGQLLNVKKSDVFPFSDALRSNKDLTISLDLESPILIDPLTPDARFLSYEWIDEESCIAVEAAGGLPEQEERAKRTIEILGLNRLASLNRKRADFWDDCLMEIANWTGATGSPSLQRVAQSGAIDKLKRMIEYDAEFSSVAQACIFKMAPEALKAAVFCDG